MLHKLKLDAPADAEALDEPEPTETSVPIG